MGEIAKEMVSTMTDDDLITYFLRLNPATDEQQMISFIERDPHYNAFRIFVAKMQEGVNMAFAIVGTGPNLRVAAYLVQLMSKPMETMTVKELQFIISLLEIWPV